METDLFPPTEGAKHTMQKLDGNGLYMLFPRRVYEHRRITRVYVCVCIYIYMRIYRIYRETHTCTVNGSPMIEVCGINQS